MRCGNACYHSVCDLFSSYLVSKIVDIKKIYITKIFAVVLCQCCSWSLTLSEKHKIGLFEEEIWSKRDASNRRLEKTA